MALYFTRSSSGNIESTASMSVDLPAALVLWMMTASGRSSFRDVQARYEASRFFDSPARPQAGNVSTIRSTRFGDFKKASASWRFSSDISGREVSGRRFQRGGDPRQLFLLQQQQQLAQVALDQFLLQPRLLGRPLDEPAPLAVAQEVEAVQVEVLAVAQSQARLSSPPGCCSCPSRRCDTRAARVSRRGIPRPAQVVAHPGWRVSTPAALLL